MKCPECHSDEVQKLSIIYESGTHITDGYSTTTGTPLRKMSGGSLWPGSNTLYTHTTSETQSLLARNAAPPGRKWVSIFFAIVIVFSTIITDLIQPLPFGVFLVLFAVGFYLGYKGWRYNKKVYPGKYAEWLKKWQCHKCGTVFSHDMNAMAST